MKILLVITRRHNNILKTEYTLENLGHEIKVVYADHYHVNCSYFAKKIDELGLHRARDNYDRNIYDKVVENINEHDIDKVLFVNYCLKKEWCHEFKKICRRNNIKVIGWMVDPLDINNYRDKYKSFYDKLFLYDLGDVNTIRRGGENVYFCPAGFNNDYKKNECNKVRDLIFVGSPYKQRMKFLNELARIAEMKGWTIEIYGPFFEEKKYFWKNIIRKLKYKYLFHHVYDGVYTSKEIAQLYASSKICLNIHLDEQLGMNPRCYEIMATGSFMLMDARVNYGDFNVGNDFETYGSISEAINKIEFYLCNKEKRENIALHGNKHVQAYSMNSSMMRIVDS